MSKKLKLSLAAVIGICFSFQNVAWGQLMTSSDEFIKQIEKNRTEFQNKMFKENQKSLATTDNFSKQLRDFQNKVNKGQQDNVLKSNTMNNDINKLRADFQKQMFIANQKQIMQGDVLKKRITDFQKNRNEEAQKTITNNNQAGLTGDMGQALNSVQEKMFKENMKKFQQTLFNSSTSPASTTR